jgi:hypothetical protein
VSHLFHLSFHIFSIFLDYRTFLCHSVTYCHIVSQYDTCHECHTCNIYHTGHKYQSHVSFIIKCVIGGLLVADSKKSGGEGGWAKSGF